MFDIFGYEKRKIDCSGFSIVSNITYIYCLCWLNTLLILPLVSPFDAEILFAETEECHFSLRWSKYFRYVHQRHSGTDLFWRMKSIFLHIILRKYLFSNFSRILSFFRLLCFNIIHIFNFSTKQKNCLLFYWKIFLFTTPFMNFSSRLYIFFFLT